MRVESVGRGLEFQIRRQSVISHLPRAMSIAHPMSIHSPRRDEARRGIIDTRLALRRRLDRQQGREISWAGACRKREAVASGALFFLGNHASNCLSRVTGPDVGIWSLDGDVGGCVWFVWWLFR